MDDQLSAEELEVGFARCMHCGERFMGEEHAEVTLKADQSEYRRHLIIHEGCYDPEIMEVA